MRLKALNLLTASQIFKCFSDESRIRILYLIYIFETMCVSDLEEVLDFTQTKTSRHLVYLKNNGLLSIEKHDQWVYYRIKEEYKGILQRYFKPFEKDQVLEKDYKICRTMYINNALSLRKLHSTQKKYIVPEPEI